MNYKKESLSRGINKDSLNMYAFCHDAEALNIFKNIVSVAVKMTKATNLTNDFFSFKSVFKNAEEQKGKKKTFTWKLLLLPIYIVTELNKNFVRYFSVLYFSSRGKCSSLSKMS